MLTIIQDTREQRGWNFDIYECEVVKGTLHTGDYTVKGFESKLVVERKATTAEISINLGSKWKQFSAELERMKEFEKRFLLCEFSLDDLLRFPEGSGIPKNKLKFIRMSGKFLVSRLTKFCDQNGIELLFCGNKAEATKTAMGIFRETYEEKDY